MNGKCFQLGNGSEAAAARQAHGQQRRQQPGQAQIENNILGHLVRAQAQQDIEPLTRAVAAPAQRQRQEAVKKYPAAGSIGPG